MLKLLLLLFILYVLVHNIKKYEYFKDTVYKYSDFYNNYLINKSKYEEILLLGFVTDDTKNYFETNFPNANITIINVEEKQYSSKSSMTKILENESPYHLLLLNSLKNNNNIYDIIILEGENDIDKIILACIMYLNVLNSEKGIFFFEMDSHDTIYNEISALIKKGYSYIKTTIQIFDYSRTNNNMGIILTIDNSKK